MKSYNRIPIIAFLLFAFTFISNAQVSNENTFYHPKQGYYTFGVNAGWAYQSSDVRTNFDGFGLGLNFGKNLYYRSGAPLSLDLRGRLLYTKSLGLDATKSFDIQDNTVLNGSQDLDYVNYPTNLNVPEGFVFQNHRTDVGELSLEAVLRLNKLRERTGVLVGFYGGIGLDYYLTRIDQENSTDLGYYTEYANLDDTQSKRNTSNFLKDNILDGDYESYADGFADGPKLDWMPSLGVELGYQLTPNFAIMAGHRTTFARNNILDGQQWADNSNDVYHYTSMGLEWNLQAGKTKLRKPEIEVRIPVSNPHTQNTQNTNVRADIKYVNSAADIEFFVNNRSTSFEYTDGKFSSNFDLNAGRNELVIVASNSVGTARKLFVINWKQGNVIDVPNTNNTPTTQNNPPTQVQRPSVRFTNPSRDNSRVNNENFRVQAEIRNVENKNNVEFLVNGRRTSFNFNTSTDRFTSDIRLNEGRNTLTLRASNTSGNDEEQTSITLERRGGDAPNVRIIRPSNNSNATTSRTNLEATVTNVNSSSDVTITVNGSRIYNFDFRNNKVTEAINLREGNNTIIVQARNQYGNDEDRVNVRYSKPVIDNEKNPPIVSISSPTNNSTSNNKTITVKGRVKNVSNKNNVRVTLNGSNISNFTFNSLSGQVSAPVTLINGNNSITIKGTNNEGQDQKTVNVRYNAGNKPTVTITSPTANPYTSPSKTTTVKATTKHIISKNGIKVYLNGRSVSNFGFTGNGSVSVTVSLEEGNNVFKIKATNPQGSAEDQTNIRYNPTPKTPPTVSISSPRNNATVSSGKVNLKAVVKHATKQQITVLLDGKNIPNFTLSGTNLTANLTVNTGVHTVVVKAQNQDGKAEKSARFTYTISIAKPIVKITKPSKSGTTVSSATTQIKATVQNTTVKKDMAVKLNGKVVPFTFNIRSKTISANLNLRKGANTIIVEATNRAGKGQAQTSITYRQIVDIETPPTSKKPKITITSVSAPAINPFEPDKGSSSIIATITNITGKNSITFTYNGQVINNFTFDTATKTFLATVDLVRGTNSVTIEARNKSGKDTVSRNIEF